MLSYEVGDRTYDTAVLFIDNLASRISNRVQLNTDGHKSYLEAVEEVFGREIDYAQLIKIYGESQVGADKRYSPFHMPSLYFVYFNFVKIHCE